MDAVELGAVRLFYGDCLEVMRWQLAGERFHLVYLDPPFMTGKVFRTKAGTFAYDDRWPSLDAYLAWVRAVVSAARELLTPDGSIVVHVDPKVSPYVRLLLDDVFGRAAFASEIVWRYRRWPSKTPNLQRVHDTLIRYVRDPRGRPRFHQLYEPLAASTLETWGTGRQRAVVAGGRRRRSEATAAASPGVQLGDVWEIPIVAPSGYERTGYPTQKPEALLERVIGSFTLQGDSVLDPCAGSGTTLAVASKLGRGAVGIDKSEAAITTVRARLSATG